MNQKRAKKLRQAMRAKGIVITTSQHMLRANGELVASEGRRHYQRAKKELGRGNR